MLLICNVCDGSSPSWHRILTQHTSNPKISISEMENLDYEQMKYDSIKKKRDNDGFNFHSSILFLIQKRKKKFI